MRVLFLALGASRRRAVIDESAQVVRSGGQAVVVIDSLDRWSRPAFDPGVEVVDLAKLVAMVRLERTTLFTAPRAVARRVGRWRLRKPVNRVRGAYEHHIANRVHRKVFLPTYRRMVFRMAPRLIERHVLRGRTFDLVVISEPRAMPVAVHLLDSFAADGGKPPELAYGIEYSGIDLDTESH